MKFWVRTALVLLLVGCSSKPSQQANAAAPGSAAPDFAFKSVEGKTVKLSDYRGKVVLLDFWATWCPPCRMSTPAVVALADKLKSQPFAVLGVSLDEETSEVPPFVKREKVKHAILYGAGSSVDQDYGVHAIPSFFILDRNGVIRKQYAGFYPGLEREWEAEIRRILAEKPKSAASH